LSPSGVFSIAALIIVSRVLGRGVDARWPMAFRLVMLGAGNFWLSRLNLDIAPGQVVWPRVVLVAGLGFVFAPLNVAAYLYIPRELRGAAVGLLALLRNEGGSVGISVSQTIQERRGYFHGLRLNEQLDTLNPAVNSFLTQARAPFLQAQRDPVAAGQMALQSLDNLRGQQASALAYFDAFLVFAAVGAGLAFIVLFMKRSVVEKGAHIAAE